MNNRTRLLRQIQGEDMNQSIRYYIEYFLDIRGRLTIWSGMDYVKGETETSLDGGGRVSRYLCPVNRDYLLSPYTQRVYQMEQERDKEISDEALIREYQSFRERHPTDGFGDRLRLLTIGGGQMFDGEGRLLRAERNDGDELLRQLWERERQDILETFGVEAPENLNSRDEYQSRLSQDRGVSSEWFRREFIRIGGKI